MSFDALSSSTRNACTGSFLTSCGSPWVAACEVELYAPTTSRIRVDHYAAKPGRFKASYGAVEQVAEVRGSTITPEDGAKIDIKRVQPVRKDSEDIQPWLGGLSALDSRKKDKLLPMMTALITHLQDGERSVASAALYLKGHMGSAYEDALREVGFGKHLAEAIRLFEPPLELVKRGYYVKMA